MNVANKPLVLVVDDQPATQELFAITLDKLGYDFILAGNGEEALEKAQKYKPAIIFMDVQMPFMDGYEAVMHLREKGFKTPVIAVTGRTHDREYDRCLKAGMSDMLIKPFKLADIKKMLKEWLNISGTAASTERRGAFPETKNSVFNAIEILDTFMNNEKTVISLLSRFIERTREQLEKIPVLENTGNWEKAKKEAHLIKGAAMTLAGSELGNAAARLEQAAGKAARDEVKTAYRATCEAFVRFKKEAEEFISTRS